MPHKSDNSYIYKIRGADGRFLQSGKMTWTKTGSHWKSLEGAKSLITWMSTKLRSGSIYRERYKENSPVVIIKYTVSESEIYDIDGNLLKDQLTAEKANNSTTEEANDLANI